VKSSERWKWESARGKKDIMRRGADAIKRSEIAVAVGLQQRRRVRRFAGVFR